MFSPSALLATYVDYRTPPEGPETYWLRYKRRMSHPVYRWYHRIESLKAQYFRRFSRRVSDAVIASWEATLGGWIFVKRCRNGPRELATLRLIAATTTIPIPKPLFSFPIWDSYLLFTIRVAGVELESVWEHLNDGEKRHVIGQLADFIRLYRAIPPPPGQSVCSVTGGPIAHSRVLFNAEAGPFRDEDHFNLQLRCGSNFEEETSLSWILGIHAIHHPLVFTHGDLAPRNIMVEGSTITAIVDWGSSGWYPAHMEYCLTRNWGWSEPWVSWIDGFLDPYHEEARADRELLERFWVPQFVLAPNAIERT